MESITELFDLLEVYQIAAAQLAPADTRCRSFSGHIRRPHIDFIQTELPGTRFFTLLREPVARVVSDYRYCLSPSHPTHRAPQ